MPGRAVARKSQGAAAVRTQDAHVRGAIRDCVQQFDGAGGVAEAVTGNVGDQGGHVGSSGTERSFGEWLGPPFVPASQTDALNRILTGRDDHVKWL